MNITPLISRDSFTLKRQGGVDSEGNRLTALTTIGEYRGTWGSPNTRDIDIAGKQNQIVDAVIAGSFTARVGDHLINLRGKNWVITMIRPLVTHNRYFLTEVV